MPIPARLCQALDDFFPRHNASVVCNRDGMEWFSCGDHVPRDCKATPIEEWFQKAGLATEGTD